MQIDAEVKKEQISTSFVWVGALEGGLRGGWSLRGVHPKMYTCLPKRIKNTLLVGGSIMSSIM
jgi:hypothetical protein